MERESERVKVTVYLFWSCFAPSYICRHNWNIRLTPIRADICYVAEEDRGAEEIREIKGWMERHGMKEEEEGE